MYIYISCIDCEGNKVKNMCTLCYGRKGGEGSYGSQKSEVKFDNFLLLMFSYLCLVRWIDMAQVRDPHTLSRICTQ